MADDKVWVISRDVKAFAVQMPDGSALEGVVWGDGAVTTRRIGSDESNYYRDWHELAATFDETAVLSYSPPVRYVTMTPR